MVASRLFPLIPALVGVALLAGCGAVPSGQTTSRTGLGEAPLRLSLTRVTEGSPLLGAQPIAQPGVYLVGVGDVVQIHVVEAPELTRPAGYLVEGDGQIVVPFLGRVPAADRPVATIQADLTQRLRRYFPNPQVDLRVTGFHSRHVSVVGDVARPSRVPLTTQPKTVIDAINEAGGFATGTRARGVVLMRNGQEIPVDIDAFLTQGAALPVLQDGDVVQVGRTARTPLRMRVSDTIALYTPGVTREQALSVGTQALTVAQMLGYANPGMIVAVHVLRAGLAGVEGYTFAADDARNPLIGGRFTLAPGDAVVLADSSTANNPETLAPIAAKLLQRKSEGI